jgi:hypothetical protein
MVGKKRPRGVPGGAWFRTKEDVTLSRLTGSGSNASKGKAPPPSQPKTVAELLDALAQVRARKIELAQQEQEILAETQKALRDHQEALLELRRRVQECGIPVDDPSSAPAVSPSAAAEPSPLQPELLSD